MAVTRAAVSQAHETRETSNSSGSTAGWASALREKVKQEPARPLLPVTQVLQESQAGLWTNMIHVCLSARSK